MATPSDTHPAPPKFTTQISMITGRDPYTDWEVVDEPVSKYMNGNFSGSVVRSISDPGRVAAMKMCKSDEAPMKRVRFQNEIQILHKIKGMSSVIQLIDTNISTTAEYDDGQSHEMKNLWAIVNIVFGNTLYYFFHHTTRDITLQESIAFCRKLLRIIAELHARGVIHRDLHPGNLLLDWPFNAPLDQATVTLLGFHIAYNTPLSMNQKKDDDAQQNQSKTNSTMGNYFYRVPQLENALERDAASGDRQRFWQARRAPTIDASNICAIFFWLLTRVEPGAIKKINECAPHETPRIREILDKKIQMIVKPHGSNIMAQQLANYLTHTFDKGFADAAEQWSVLELDLHFQLIEDLLNDAAQYRPPKTDVNEFQYSPDERFQQAADLFTRAKRALIDNNVERNFSWVSGGTCQWTHEATDERRSIDILNYCLIDKPEESISTAIVCVAMVDEHSKMKLLIEIFVSGRPMQLPLSSWEKYGVIEMENDIDALFDLELKNLIKVISAKQTVVKPCH